MRRTDLRIRLWQQIADSLSVLYGDQEEWDYLIARYNTLSLSPARTEHMSTQARNLARRGEITEALGMHSFLGERQWESVKRLLMQWIRHTKSPQDANSAIEALQSTVQQIERMDCWPEMDRAIERALRKNNDLSLRQATEYAALGCSERTLKLVFDHLRTPLAERTPNMTPAPPVHSSLDDDMGDEPTEDTVTDLGSPAKNPKPTPAEKTDEDSLEELGDSFIVWEDLSEDEEDSAFDELEETDILDDIPDGAITQ